MSRVSSIFTVTAINDGATITANMQSSQPLAQVKNGDSYAPDWTNTDLQPTLSIHAYKNGNACAVSEGKWYFNGSEISSQDERFNINSTTGNTPSLKIVKNLGEDSNDDVISFRGKVMLDMSSVDFEVSRLVKITESASAGYTGVIYFCDSTGDISRPSGSAFTEEVETLYMKGILYNGTTSENVFQMVWYKDGVPVNPNGNNQSSGTPSKTTDKLTLSRDNVDDHAAITCEFYKGDDLVATAFANVDDETDAFEMFIASEVVVSNTVQGNSSTPAAEGETQIRYGQTARVFAWMGNNHDPSTVQTDWSFYARVYNASKQEVTGKSSVWGTYDNNSNAYNITKSTLPSSTNFTSLLSGKVHGRMEITYDLLNGELGNQISVMVIATK